MESCTLLKKQMLNFKPVIRKSDIRYIRNEKNNSISIAFKSSIDNLPILFSDIEYNFINLCNGSNSLIDIVDSISKSYDTIPWMIHMSNSVHLISYLTNLRVVFTNDSHPLFQDSTLNLEKGIKVESIQYFRLNECEELIKKAILNQNEYYFYINPFKDIKVYSEVYFNRELKNPINEIFIIKNNNDAIAVIMLSYDNDRNQLILEDFIIMKSSVEMIILDNFNKLFPNKKITSLKINLTNQDSIIESIFNSDKLNEVILKDELLNEVDIREINLYY